MSLCTVIQNFRDRVPVLSTAEIGGLKVTTENGWFAARPSGTEDVYKLYAESFKGKEHLARIQEEAHAVIQKAFQAGAAGRKP